MISDVDRTIGQELVGIVFEKVVSCYEAYQAKRGRIRQHLAIQNWFNLNFMCQLFNPSNSDEKVLLCLIVVERPLWLILKKCR